jgi:hypothetical protein
MKLRYMDKAKSSEIGSSGNMVDFPTSKKERIIAHILATKFHIEPATDSKLEAMINPTMRDLIINRPVVKKKWRK